MFVPLFRSCLNDDDDNDDADDNKKGLTRMTERIICQGKQIENWQKRSFESPLYLLTPCSLPEWAGSERKNHDLNSKRLFLSSGGLHWTFTLVLSL